MSSAHTHQALATVSRSKSRNRYSAKEIGIATKRLSPLTRTPTTAIARFAAVSRSS